MGNWKISLSAGARFSGWAALDLIIAAETSAAAFLGTPSEGFKNRSFLFGQLVIGRIHTYEDLLAVFLLGILTRRRGSNLGNVIEMRLGNVAVFVLSKVELFGIHFGGWLPEWRLKIAWSWYVFIGCAVVSLVAAMFHTKPKI